MSLQRTVCIAAGLACAAVWSPSSGDIINPAVTFAVNDDDGDGLGDSFPSATLNNSIITRFGNRRVMAEFDLASLAGPVIQSATVNGTLDENFSFRFGTRPADFEVVLYAGNGAADLSDFQITAVSLGTVNILDDGFDLAPFSFDAAAALQDLVDDGATHAGVRIRAVQDGVGEVDAIDLTLDVTAVPAPAAPAAALAGLALAAARRRR